MLHTDMPVTAADLDQDEYSRLPAQGLENRISGKCFVGLYRAPFQYVAKVSAGGTMWGQNNYGTQDDGNWSIDAASGGFTVIWNGGWDNTTTTGYSDGQAIHMFDAETGLWRTTFLREITESELPALLKDQASK